VSLVGFRVPWCMGAPRRGPRHHLMVRVVGCCLCLQALVVLHGCLWSVVTVCALFKVVDGSGIRLLGDMALPHPSCCGGCGRWMSVAAAIDDRGDGGEVTASGRCGWWW